MSLLAVLVLATTTARVEAVTLTTVDARLAVRVAVSGEPGMVAVRREGEDARVSLGDATLGGQFAGGSRFAWNPAPDAPAVLAAPARLDRIEVAAGRGEVSVLLRVPPDVSIDVRRDPGGFLLVFREGPDALPPPAPRGPPVAAAAEPGEPLDIEPLPEPVDIEPLPRTVDPQPETAEPGDVESLSEPVDIEPLPRTVDVQPETAEPGDVAPLPETGPPPPVEPPSDEPRREPSPSTAELARGLFPAAAGAAAAAEAGQASVSELYPQLFPGGPPHTAPETVEPAPEPMAGAGGVPFGPFRVRAGVDARYVDADTYVEGPAERTRARYLEVVPRVTAEAPLADGRLALEYRPSLRAFSDIDEVNSNSHRARAGIHLPLGPAVTARLQDTFVSGVLDTRDVDPGGEYFFDLGHFRRNRIDGGLSILLNPRLSLELAAATTALRFQEESSFFDYDARLASAGLGYELTPTLKTALLYSYDTVPTPAERPEAAYRAHNAQLTFTGDILPLVSGQLMLGYRDQSSPNAGPGGTRYRGFTMAGSVTKQFTHDSDVTLFVDRSTPVSAFEENAFYVYTAVQASGRFPLPLEFQLRGGLGYQWNDYRTVAAGIGEPREDRVFGYHVGLRRSVLRQLFLSAAYRREERHSNLERFDTDSDGFFLQLEWDIFGYAP
jgi:hypothetical protein